MTSNDPETQAMRDGAEIEKGAGDEQGVQHTVKTHPDEQPRTADGDAPLTTDPEAQKNDSVIDPEAS